MQAARKLAVAKKHKELEKALEIHGFRYHGAYFAHDEKSDAAQRAAIRFVVFDDMTIAEALNRVVADVKARPTRRHGANASFKTQSPTYRTDYGASESCAVVAALHVADVELSLEAAAVEIF